MCISTASWWLDILLCLCVFLCLLAVYFAARLRFKAQIPGSFNTAYRDAGSKNWVAGVCHYSVRALKWYRVLSLKWGSVFRWPRSDFEILEVRTLVQDGISMAVLRCSSGGQEFYLGMNEHDYSGLVSWKESSPPLSEEMY